MKIYINKIGENWIVDRLRNEWIEYNYQTHTKNIFFADIVWVIAPWTWKWYYKFFFKFKKVLYTIHHFEEKDFNDSSLKSFQKRDRYIDTYHVLNKDVFNQLSKITNKPIIQIPFWINQNIFFEIENNKKLRKEFNFSDNDFLIGSFQRDTEGHDLKSPKLIKGPDRLLEILISYNNKVENLKVILTGKRRQYIISELNKNNIKFKYFEDCSFEDLNKLYNCLDLYIVSSRTEGGPFSILECGISKTPIISTKVGIADLILSDESLFNMENFNNANPNIDVAYNNSLKYSIPEGFDQFNFMFKKLLDD